MHIVDRLCIYNAFVFHAHILVLHRRMENLKNSRQDDFHGPIRYSMHWKTGTDTNAAPTYHVKYTYFVMSSSENPHVDNCRWPTYLKVT